MPEHPKLFPLLTCFAVLDELKDMVRHPAVEGAAEALRREALLAALEDRQPVDQRNDRGAG
jgi:hypothetical protein